MGSICAEGGGSRRRRGGALAGETEFQPSPGPANPAAAPRRFGPPPAHPPETALESGRRRRRARLRAWVLPPPLRCRGSDTTGRSAWRQIGLGLFWALFRRTDLKGRQSGSPCNGLKRAANRERAHEMDATTPQRPPRTPGRAASATPAGRRLPAWGSASLAAPTTPGGGAATPGRVPKAALKHFVLSEHPSVPAPEPFPR